MKRVTHGNAVGGDGHLPGYQSGGVACYAATVPALEPSHLDTETLQRAQQTIDHAARELSLKDWQQDSLRECLRMARQREYLAEAVTRLRAREADLLEALRKYLALHNSYEPCICDCCHTARTVVRR